VTAIAIGYSQRRAVAQSMIGAECPETYVSSSRISRAGMISVIGLSVRRQVTAHRQGAKRGARTSMVPNDDNKRRRRISLIGGGKPQCEHRRRSRQ
jgi:hypothetical protein